MKLTFSGFKEVVEWQFKSYEEKLEVAHDAIREALKQSKRPCVAFSGGKNSLVVLHLVLQRKPDVKVVFNNTGVEYPETVKFVRQIAKEWNLNFHEIKPKISFWKIVKKYGFPKPSRYRKDKEPMCCRLLKTQPTAEFYIKQHIDCYFTGISAFESRARLVRIAKYGLVTKVGYVGRNAKLPRKIIACYPVGLWTDRDIWRYIEENDLPVNPAYEKYGLERTGCYCCTNYIGWEKVLSRTHPHVYRKIMRMMGYSVLEDYAEADG
jgi:phosphoadenosine phosphosulfate reductase